MLSNAELIINEYNTAAEKNPKSAVIICGPTASGKTGLSLELAKSLNGEIVSCDSMQIYRYMNIGTAKATAEEQAVAPHHMIDIIDPWENYSVYQYKESAEKCINDIISRGKVPIIVGGTGLYVNSLADNRQYTQSFNETDVFDVDALMNAKALAETGDFTSLYDLLCSIDPKAAEKIHVNNTKRLIRAVELFYITGKTQEVRNSESLMIPPEVYYNIYCLNPEREILYNKINKRVDLMVEEGLLEEIALVYNMCTEHVGEAECADSLTSLQAIGYKEFLPLIKNQTPTSEMLEFAVEATKLNSRHYAKRQLTWFRRTPGIKFLQTEM